MNKQKVWIVCQYQPEEGYQGYPVATFTNEKDALDLCRRLNKDYGAGVVFDDDWDFLEYTMKDDPHYYEVIWSELNPQQKDY